MTCDAVTAWLFEAGLDDIRSRLGGGAGDLGGHLTGCAACRAMATALVEETEALAAAVAESARGEPDLDTILAEARTPEVNARRRWRRLRRSTGTIVLAAAAAFAGLLLVDRDPAELPGTPLLAHAPTRTTPGLDLDTEANAAVLTTTDPAITVIWFYE